MKKFKELCEEILNENKYSGLKDELIELIITFYRNNLKKSVTKDDEEELVDEINSIIDNNKSAEMKIKYILDMFDFSNKQEIQIKKIVKELLKQEK